MYDIRIVAILTANDNGTQAARDTPDSITTSVNLANEIYNPHGINFLFDPATDIYRFNDDLLNRDCKRRDHEIYTNKDLDPANNPGMDVDLYNNRRNELALKFPGRITVFFTTGLRYRWDKTEKRWIYDKRTFSWSNSVDEFATMASGDSANYNFAHEVGHFFHLGHTHTYCPETIKDAAQFIRDKVEKEKFSKNKAADVFDGDGIADTPPDPGISLFKNPCDAAETSVTIPVSFTDGTKKDYTFTPDRENIMNYWDKTCRGETPRISPGQASKALDVLRKKNRNHLIAPVVLYYGTWGFGERSQTRALAWSLNDFTKRFDMELTEKRFCKHMQAYDIGGGQIRYDGVWEAGDTKGQTHALALTFNDFVLRFDKERKAKRFCTHMQAYNIGGGQMRYDSIWEDGGNKKQPGALGWTLNNFIKRFDIELTEKRFCKHMQAYDIGGGQIRYDGVWEDGDTKGQTYALALTLDDFTLRFDKEISANRACVHMQAYDIGGGQIRYDGIWEDGDTKERTYALMLKFNDFVARCKQGTTKARRLTHFQAYDIGGGQIRFDGIWERDPNVVQKRVLGLPIITFADHLDELTSSGYHVERMFAGLRAYETQRTVLSVSGSAPNTAPGSVFFESDLEPRTAALIKEPLSKRGTGCELKPTKAIRD